MDKDYIRSVLSYGACWVRQVCMIETGVLLILVTEHYLFFVTDTGIEAVHKYYTEIRELRAQLIVRHWACTNRLS